LKKPIHLCDALRAFREFVRTVNISNDGQWQPNTNEYGFSCEDLTVLLSGADAVSYQGCLHDLYAAVAPKEMLSRGTVENLANAAFGRIARKGLRSAKETSEFQSVCDHELKKLREALERKPSTWEVIQRACGIDQVGLPLKVGKVDFVLATPDVLDSIPEAQFTKGVTRERFAGKVLCRISVPAVDIDAARATATRILQQTMDCLNFFAAAAGVPGQAYVLGEKERGLGASVSLGPDNHVVHQSFLYGPVQPLPLQRLARQPGFERISKMLESDSLGKLQDRILRALQWAGRARVDSRREESFLLMAIALESLLLPDQRDDNIGYRIALRCTHLIAVPDVTARKSLMKNVRDLYNRRSMIVHSGKIEVSDTELALLWHYLRAALYVVVNTMPFSTMSDEKAYHEWFDERVLEVQVPDQQQV